MLASKRKIRRSLKRSVLKENKLICSNLINEVADFADKIESDSKSAKDSIMRGAKEMEDVVKSKSFASGIESWFNSIGIVDPCDLVKRDRSKLEKELSAFESAQEDLRRANAQNIHNKLGSFAGAMFIGGASSMSMFVVQNVDKIIRDGVVGTAKGVKNMFLGLDAKDVAAQKKSDIETWQKAQSTETDPKKILNDKTWAKRDQAGGNYDPLNPQTLPATEVPGGVSDIKGTTVDNVLSNKLFLTKDQREEHLDQLTAVIRRIGVWVGPDLWPRHPYADFEYEVKDNFKNFDAKVGLPRLDYAEYEPFMVYRVVNPMKPIKGINRRVNGIVPGEPDGIGESPASILSAYKNNPEDFGGSSENEWRFHKKTKAPDDLIDMHKGWLKLETEKTAMANHPDALVLKDTAPDLFALAIDEWWTVFGGRSGLSKSNYLSKIGRILNSVGREASRHEGIVDVVKNFWSDQARKIKRKRGELAGTVDKQKFRNRAELEELPVDSVVGGKMTTRGPDGKIVDKPSDYRGQAWGVTGGLMILSGAIIHLYKSLLDFAPGVACTVKEFVASTVKTIGKAVKWVYDNTIGAVINALGRFIKWAWEYITEGTVGDLKLLNKKLLELDSAARVCAESVGDYRVSYLSENIADSVRLELKKRNDSTLLKDMTKNLKEELARRKTRASRKSQKRFEEAKKDWLLKKRNKAPRLSDFFLTEVSGFNAADFAPSEAIQKAQGKIQRNQLLDAFELFKHMKGLGTNERDIEKIIRKRKNDLVNLYDEWEELMKTFAFERKTIEDYKSDKTVKALSNMAGAGMGYWAMTDEKAKKAIGDNLKFAANWVGGKFTGGKPIAASDIEPGKIVNPETGNIEDQKIKKAKVTSQAGVGYTMTDNGSEIWIATEDGSQKLGPFDSTEAVIAHFENSGDPLTAMSENFATNGESVLSEEGIMGGIGKALGDGLSKMIGGSTTNLIARAGAGIGTAAVTKIATQYSMAAAKKFYDGLDLDSDLVEWLDSEGMDDEAELIKKALEAADHAGYGESGKGY